jgi:hypothetical protein
MIDDHKMEASKGENGLYPSPFYFLEEIWTEGGDKK